VLPHRFQLHRSATLGAALELRARYGDDAAYYAGGTELLLAMKARVLRYDHLIDLKNITSLRGVQLESEEIVIGALTTHLDLARDALVHRLIPAYAALSNNIANIRVRVAGTIGGNLCFGEPHADPPALLAALDARVELQGPEGIRSVAVADFIEDEFTTQRRDDEIMIAVRIPVPRPAHNFTYLKFGHLERPAVGIAAGCCADAGATSYRIWAGSIGSRPIRIEKLEAALKGIPPNSVGDVLKINAVAAAADLPARDDLHGSADYKLHLASVLMQRAVLQVAGQSPDGGKDDGI
jgi:carbon-monoxide dehydrogenase medium subunit